MNVCAPYWTLSKIKFKHSKRSAYTVVHKVLNTSDFGVPQYRQRWYCIGIRNGIIRRSGGRSFQFPTPTPTPPLSEFLGASHGKESYFEKETATAKSNINKAIAEIRKSGLDPTKELFVVDCDASKSMTKHMQNLSPCITRSRPHGHWITNLNRRMTLKEMMLLQGIGPKKVKLAGNRKEQGQQIGNSMSVNVLQLLLKEILVIHGTIDEGASQGKMMIASKPRQLIVDSGATFHLVCEETLTPSERKGLRSIPKMSLQIANGDISTSHVTDIHVKELNITVTALVLPDTESVLSMGKLVAEHGYQVTWKADTGPVLAKDGKSITCRVSQAVPQLQVGTTTQNPTDSAQAPESGGNIAPTQPEPDVTQIDSEETDKIVKKKRKRSKKVTGQCQHNIFTHFPKSKDCEICQDNRTHRAYCRTNTADHIGNLPEPT